MSAVAEFGPEERSDLAVRVGVAIVAGALLSLLPAPFDLHWLQWVAYVPFLWTLRADRPRQSLLLAFVYGTAAEATIFRWLFNTIDIFSNIPAIGAFVLLVGFSMLFGGLPYLVSWAGLHALRKRFGLGWIVALPALHAVLEEVSAHVILFPYNQGIAQYTNHQVIQLASITGMTGITFLVLFVNCVLGEFIYRARDGKKPIYELLLAPAILLLLVSLYGKWRFDRIEGELAGAPLFKVAQIQTHISIMERIEMSGSDAFYLWYRKTSKIKPGSVDLVVWPEGASPYGLDEPQAGKLVGDLAIRGKFDVIVGGGLIKWNPDGTRAIAMNSVYLVHPDGTLGERYDKMNPLPFGEYMPLEHSPLGFLVSWIEGPGDFQAGQEAVLLHGKKTYATPICYEAILPSVCRMFGPHDLTVTVTQDAWFGDTAAPWQHGMLAAVRAVELGTPMYRSAFTGVSFAVEPHGVIYAETQPFTDASNVVPIRLRRFDTFYAQWGPWFPILCGLGLAVGWGVAPWIRKEG